MSLRNHKGYQERKTLMRVKRDETVLFMCRVSREYKHINSSACTWMMSFRITPGNEEHVQELRWWRKEIKAFSSCLQKASREKHKFQRVFENRELFKTTQEMRNTCKNIDGQKKLNRLLHVYNKPQEETYKFPRVCNPNIPGLACAWVKLKLVKTRKPFRAYLLLVKDSHGHARRVEEKWLPSA